MYKFLNLLEYVISLAISLRIAGWVLGSPERSLSSLDVVIADAEWAPKSKALNHLINFKLLMQEAPNSYEKDEQQERGNYDSANYTE